MLHTEDLLAHIKAYLSASRRLLTFFTMFFVSEVELVDCSDIPSVLALLSYWFHLWTSSFCSRDAGTEIKDASDVRQSTSFCRTRNLSPLYRILDHFHLFCIREATKRAVFIYIMKLT